VKACDSNMFYPVHYSPIPFEYPGLQASRYPYPRRPISMVQVPGMDMGNQVEDNLVVRPGIIVPNKLCNANGSTRELVCKKLLTDIRGN
jgi:hypothetical protein